MLNRNKILPPDPSDKKPVIPPLLNITAQQTKAAVITPLLHVYFHKPKDWLNWI